MERAKVKKIVPPLFVIMVVIFSIICIFFYRNSIETQLTDNVNAALQQSNIPLSETVEVEFSGRDAYVKGWVENSSDKERVYDIVDNVEGVKLVYTDLQMKEEVAPEPVVEKVVAPVVPVVTEVVEQVIEQPVVVQEVIEQPVVVAEPVIVQEVYQEPEVIVQDNRDIKKMINTKIVYFDLNKTFIKPEFNDELSEVQSILSEYPDSRVKITGYADRRGTAEDNMELSKNRALEVQKYLVDSGVSSEQLVIDYKGEVIRNDRYYWRYYKYDRKVEFKLLDQIISH